MIRNLVFKAGGTNSDDDLPEAKYAKEEWKQQSWLDSDCSLTFMIGATLSTPQKAPA